MTATVSLLVTYPNGVTSLLHLPLFIVLTHSIDLERAGSDQCSTGFMTINQNSSTPGVVESGNGMGQNVTTLSESAAILTLLSIGTAFVPTNVQPKQQQCDCTNWVCWASSNFKQTKALLV